jgi:anoctamin-10
MNGIEEEQTAFEIGVVVPKRNEEENEDFDCVKVLVDEFRKVGLFVERVQGVADEFIKVWFSNLSPYHSYNHLFPPLSFI